MLQNSCNLKGGIVLAKINLGKNELELYFHFDSECRKYYLMVELYHTCRCETEVQLHYSPTKSREIAKEIWDNERITFDHYCSTCDTKAHYVFTKEDLEDELVALKYWQAPRQLGWVK